MALSQKPTNELRSRIIGAAIQVHRELGPGLLESSYEDCLSLELEQAGIVFSRQPFLPIVYKGHKLHGCYRPDLIVDQMVIVEVKAIEKVVNIHKAQLLTYLKHTNLKVGLLLNFNTEVLRDGITRISR